MARDWTFGQKIGAGFAVVVMLAVSIGAVATYALRSVVSAKDRVITVNAQNLIDAERLHALVERKASTFRLFLFTREARHLETLRGVRAEHIEMFDRLRRTVYTDDGRQLLDQVARAEQELNREIDGVIALRQTDASVEAVVRVFNDKILPRKATVDGRISEFVVREGRLLGDARQAASDTAAGAIRLVLLIAGLTVVLAAILAFVLTRTLGRQIGAALGQVQSSSAELQAAANQQATGTKEQVTSMNEISTTLRELLATSRQIAESAQRVAQIAGQTASAARAGQETVDKGHASIGDIRRQIDLVVSHMLDLGRKSQQMGAVLDIVSELAEQTNILSINATIEAAGAGEAGKRFAVVADEIRKLADRVSGSTKEIRSLIDVIRGAVNTTVMATEGGAKAVDAGALQFGEVAAAFTQIAGLVATTTDAAREIELSTKQQATAAEQVNIAVVNVAQASQEMETSSTQTLQTAAQLAALSRDLQRVIAAEARA